MIGRFYVAPQEAGLNDLLAHYGAQVGDRLVYDAQCETDRSYPEYVRLCFYDQHALSLHPANRPDHEHPSHRTGIGRRGIALYDDHRPVQGVPPGVHFTPLLYTSPKSWLAKAQPYASVAAE